MDGGRGATDGVGRGNSKAEHRPTVTGRLIGSATMVRRLGAFVAAAQGQLNCYLRWQKKKNPGTG